MRSSIRFTLIAVAASCLVASQAQQVQQAASSRLSALVLDVLPAKVQVASVQSKDGRLGSMLLAQIPPQPQPVIQPGQNPNAVRPIVRPGTNPKRNPALAQPPVGNAGTPAPAIAPGITTPPPATAAPPPTSPVAVQSAAVPPQPQVSPNPPPATAGDDEPINFDFTGPLTDILNLYGNLIDKKVIRDINLESVTFTLTTDTPLPKKDAIDFIQRSLLINGYGFLPAGEKFVKCVMLAQIKPGAELDIKKIYSEQQLPKDGEEVAMFIQPLQYLEPDDLAKTLQTLVQLHAYGAIQPLPNSRGIAILENINTIRMIIGLLEHLDVAPSPTTKKTFQLTRSSAEDVAKALADILGLDNKSSSGGSSGGSKPSTPQPLQPQPVAGIPNQPGGAPQQHASGVYGSAPQAVATPPKLIPITRTNSLLVIARQADIDNIATLIDELDAAATIKKFMSVPLHYLDAGNVLQILGDSLQALAPEGDGGGGSGGKSSSGSILGGANGNPNNQQRSTGSAGRSGGSNSFGNNGIGGGSNAFGSGYGSGGLGGGGGGFGGGAGGNLQPLRQNEEPQSLVVGKTLLIADPTQNEIFVTGPPEQMETIKMILEELDVRPRMVVLSAVIGTIGVDNNKEFGIDYLFKPTEVKLGKFNGNVAGSATTKNGGFIDPSTISSIKDFGTIGTGLSLFGTFNDQVNVALKALNSSSDFKTLSRPTIYTLNNQPASINTGQKVPVPTSTGYNSGFNGVNNGGLNNGVANNGYNPPGVGYQDVFLTLSVSPLIMNDNEIKLTVQQKNDSLGATVIIGGNPAPTINSQGLDTTVLVKNNATVLLGGLISDSTTKSRSGIPVLKDLPLLKYVFSSTTDKVNRNELLIFISPRIVTGEGDEPPNATDGPGSSALGQDSQRFMNVERTDPAREIKEVRRSKIGKLLHKLFE